MYTEKELVGIAKRENNAMRSYLVVNRFQGKHVPADPEAVFSLFGELAERVSKAYPGEKLLLIGFAETATAIGAALAVQMGTFYMQTTREQIEGVEYLYFSEAHSHATEQKLVKTDLDAVIGEVDRIVFVEDEITTGNTVKNIVDILEEQYGKQLRFSVASLLNGMSRENEACFEKRGIETIFLLKTGHSGYSEIAGRCLGDGRCFPCDIGENGEELRIFEIFGGQNARRLVSGKSYGAACEKLCRQISEKIIFGSGERILVVGTEEFMYPALVAAEHIKKLGNQVRCHSTTRSPIIVSREETYPLHTRYELASLYDRERKTFLYDIDRYDKVLLLTDAPSGQQEGIRSLVNAVRKAENEEIYLVRWCTDEKFI